jgi:hypothetical protein
MTPDELTQLVVFRTELPPERFVPAWEPTAAGFLRRGLATITLAGFDPQRHGGIAFVSRNSWPTGDYGRTFPSGLAADAGAGPIAVRQAGAFSVHPASHSPVAAAQPEGDLSLALIQADPSGTDDVVSTLLAALASDPSRRTVVYAAAYDAQPFQIAVTVHGPAGTGGESTDALAASLEGCPAVRGRVLLTGRELLSLPS